MKYNKIFITIVLISSISGIFLALLNNELIMNKENKFNRNNIIPIAINIDNNYYLQAIVFLTSLLENIGPTTKYEIYIMISDEFEYNSKNCIDSLIVKYGNEKINIEYINMKDRFISAVTNEFITTAAYYRLLLPSLLPNIDKIIYFDCDVINFGDLSDMYNLNLNENIYYRGILDYYSNTKELLIFGINSDMYINSGILLINLKSLRINEIEKELIEVCEKKYLRHHDQTAINLVCLGHMEKLPIKYGIFKFDSFSHLVKYNDEQNKKYRYNKNELKEGYYSPLNLHFAGYDKPWNHANVKFEEYWWYFAKKSEFYKQILNVFGYDSEMIDNIMKNLPKKDGFIRFK